MSATLTLQKAIRARLTGAAPVTALVPAANILDRNSRPVIDPSIIIGEDQEVDESRLARNVVRIYSTIHVWKKEPSTAGVKAIAGAITSALHASRPELDAPYQCGDCYVAGTHYLRDPDGETSHAVVTIESLVAEVS